MKINNLRCSDFVELTLFTLSVNRFFVKGQEGIYYTYNNGKLASDPKLACANFVNALERIPKVIESHEKELAKATANIGVYTAIANGSWRKEDELRSLKSQAAELDRKIALELAPPEPEKGEVKEGEKQGQETMQGSSVQGTKQEPAHTLPQHTTMPQSPIHTPKSESEDRGIMSRVVISKPKWR